MMFVVLVGLVLAIGWFNTPNRIGALSDATEGTGISED